MEMREEDWDADCVHVPVSKPNEESSVTSEGSRDRSRNQNPRVFYNKRLNSGRSSENDRREYHRREYDRREYDRREYDRREYDRRENDRRRSRDNWQQDGFKGQHQMNSSSNSSYANSHREDSSTTNQKSYYSSKNSNALSTDRELRSENFGGRGQGRGRGRGRGVLWEEKDQPEYQPRSYRDRSNQENGQHYRKSGKLGHRNGRGRRNWTNGNDERPVEKDQLTNGSPEGLPTNTSSPEAKSNCVQSSVVKDDIHFPPLVQPETGAPQPNYWRDRHAFVKDAQPKTQDEEMEMLNRALQESRMLEEERQKQIREEEEKELNRLLSDHDGSLLEPEELGASADDAAAIRQHRSEFNRAVDVGYTVNTEQSFSGDRRLPHRGDIANDAGYGEHSRHSVRLRLDDIDDLSSTNDSIEDTDSVPANEETPPDVIYQDVPEICDIRRSAAPDVIHQTPPSSTQLHANSSELYKHMKVVIDGTSDAECANNNALRSAHDNEQSATVTEIQKPRDNVACVPVSGPADGQNHVDSIDEPSSSSNLSSAVCRSPAHAPSPSSESVVENGCPPVMDTVGQFPVCSMPSALHRYPLMPPSTVSHVPIMPGFYAPGVPAIPPWPYLIPGMMPGVAPPGMLPPPGMIPPHSMSFPAMAAPRPWYQPVPVPGFSYYPYFPVTPAMPLADLGKEGDSVTNDSKPL